ncbi:SMI1/KNR4 family protein [Paraflavitalea pollutisoli]|uniref:SMI1/KNR4 family protein n=1 Tax=Paraflavitalea pollutisoli TaxID=3034143 RepID=UPI0023ED7155|nr:SMI1/KNR4 family protein [Paraflavitalea sp. H1-2-19X]
METIVFTNQEQALTDSDLQAFEKLINAKLPPDFIDFYRQHNGGIPQNAKYSWGDELVVPLKGFYPITHGKETIESKLAAFKAQGVDFGNKIPFAWNRSEFLFGFSVSPDDYGYIYSWKPKFPEKLTGEFTYHCSNLKTMLDGLSMRFTK